VNVAYAADGTLFMAYYDTSSTTLELQSRNPQGVWSAPQTVDGLPGCGGALSLAVDGQGHPGIAYYDATHLDLKYAHFDGAGWSVQTVDAYRTVGQFPSLAFDGSGAPVIAYYQRSLGDLRVATFSNSVWRIATVDSSGDVGRYPSVAIDSATGQCGIGYLDATDGWFKYATARRGRWYTSVVDTATVMGGGSISVAFDRSHLPAMSYYDSYAGTIRYAHFDGSTWSAARLARHLTGAYTNLSFDAQNQPDILYYNYAGDAVFAADFSSSAWGFASVAAPGGLGLSVAHGPGGHTSLSWLGSDAAGVADL
jgi:hypothetical protein